MIWILVLVMPPTVIITTIFILNAWQIILGIVALVIVQYTVSLMMDILFMVHGIHLVFWHLHVGQQETTVRKQLPQDAAED